MKIQLRDPNEFRKMLLVNGYSQRSFAKKIDVSGPYLNQIINKDRSPSPLISKKIVEGLGMQFEDIFFIEDACNSKQTN